MKSAAADEHYRSLTWWHISMASTNLFTFK